MLSQNQSVKQSLKYQPSIFNLLLRITGRNKTQHIGNLGELFRSLTDKSTFEAVHRGMYPNAAHMAGHAMFKVGQELIKTLTQLTVEDYIAFFEDLLYTKSPKGFSIEIAILKKVASDKGERYKGPTKKQEAMGIDGRVGKSFYQVKPISYKTIPNYGDNIKADFIIFYRSETDYVIEPNNMR